MRPPAGRVAPLPLLVLLGLFIVFLVLLVAQSLAPRQVLEFPLPDSTVAVAGRGNAVDTVTLDARDEHRWRFFDLDTRTALSPPATQGWDIAARRFHLVARASAADLGRTAWDTPAPNDPPYVETVFAQDTVNPALARWYRYGFLSHLLESKDHIYLVRTTRDRVFRVQVLSYYCVGTLPGCLTLRIGPVSDADHHSSAPSRIMPTRSTPTQGGSAPRAASGWRGLEGADSSQADAGGGRGVQRGGGAADRSAVVQ
jgi:hypothetical protein